MSRWDTAKEKKKWLCLRREGNGHQRFVKSLEQKFFKNKLINRTFKVCFWILMKPGGRRDWLHPSAFCSVQTFLGKQFIFCSYGRCQTSGYGETSKQLLCTLLSRLSLQTGSWRALGKVIKTVASTLLKTRVCLFYGAEEISLKGSLSP